jgi:hypothetical protein
MRDADSPPGYLLTVRAGAPGTAGRKAVVADWQRSGGSACASPFAGAVNRSTISVVARLAGIGGGFLGVIGAHGASCCGGGRTISD